MVDPGRVQRLLEALDFYRAHLGSLRDLPDAEYTGERAFAGRYLVQAAAQASIDIANHLIASEGWRAPADFRDAFTVLEEHDVIYDSLAARMRDLAGLRNRLVHIYGDVDDQLIHASLADGLRDLEDYARTIAVLLDRER